MKATLSTKSWPIRGSFTISRGSKTQVDTVMVTLEAEGVGVKTIGRGECVPYGRYGESIDSVIAQLEQVIPLVEEDSDRQQLQGLLPAGAARNALDCAFWDLECKQQGVTVWEKLGIEPQPLTTAFTLSLDTPEKMRQKAVENDFRALLKLKLGGADDLARIKAVREGAPKARIVLDANEAWTPELYQQLIPELMKLDIAMIEQPFPADQDHMLASLPRPIPICADESCHDKGSLDSIIGRYDMINIKIDKTGGLTEALELKKAAEAADLRIMVGCMLSSSLSMAPAFVVAQGADVVDLDGPLLLSEDIDFGFQFSGSEMLPFTTKLWG